MTVSPTARWSVDPGEDAASALRVPTACRAKTVTFLCGPQYRPSDCVKLEKAHGAQPKRWHVGVLDRVDPSL